MEPEFLSWDDVLYLHERSLAEHGGSAGIRDRGLIESAIAQPQQDYCFGGADHFAIAAAYAFHIAQAQAFLDGNKRTAIAAALIFLNLNGIATRGRSDELYEAMIAIAERRLDKPGLAALFRQLFA
jgi:death-on-curing protein